MSWNAVTALVVVATVGIALSLDYQRGYLQSGYGLFGKRRRARR